MLHRIPSALKGVGIGILDFHVKPFAALLAVVTHPVDGLIKSANSSARRKLVASASTTRLSEGVEAFALSSPSDRAALLKAFARVDVHTAERRKEYHDWAKRAIDKWQKGKGERKASKGKGKGRETPTGSATPSVASTDQESWEAFEEMMREDATGSLRRTETGESWGSGRMKPQSERKEKKKEMEGSSRGWEEWETKG